MEWEYRITWQREGATKQRALRQTLQGAEREARRQETAHEEMDWLPRPLKPLFYGPMIEKRAVGAWGPL